MADDGRLFPGWYLEDLLRILVDAGVEFIVAGGVAGVLHGIERSTLDLDIALDFAPDNVARFAEAMKRAGLQPLVPVPIMALASPEAVTRMVEEKKAIIFMLADPRMTLRKIDVFLTRDLAYARLAADAETIELSGMRIRIVSLTMLAEMKRRISPLRAKDRFDLSAIEQLLEERRHHGL